MKVTDNDIRQAMEHRLSALDGASWRGARPDGEPVHVIRRAGWAL